MDVRDIVVIGASAGGFEAVRFLVSQLPADLPAAVFITLHLPSRNESRLPELLSLCGPLKAIHPVEMETIRPGTIYVAPPDYHLILTPGEVHLGHGPRENLQRPCINTMFRSAAAAYGSRVAGVVLTGMLDDGAAGLWEIGQHGGATIAQDPEEAAFRSMPETAIRGLNVQYIVRLSELVPLLTRLSQGDAAAAARTSGEATQLPTTQACPECGGVMKLTQRGGLQEYSCHTGHRLGLKTMIAEKTDHVERALGNALSQSEELIDLLRQAEQGYGADASESLRRELQYRTQQVKEVKQLLNAHPARQLQI